VAGGQIGEPVGGHLVGDGVDVAEVFDGQVALPFGLGEERDGREFGDEDRGGEVVRFHALAEEVGEVAGRGVAEDEVAEGLQQDGARRVHAQRFPLEVDAAVAGVGD